MIIKASIKALIFPAILTIAGLSVLVSLGVWQLDRLVWKEDLLARIDSRMASLPKALPNAIRNPDELEYRRVRVTGTFQHGLEMLVYRTGPNGNPGFHVYTPLIRPDAAAVIINRGWIPVDKENPVTRQEGQLEGLRTIEGVVRLTRKAGWFAPENDPEQNRWYRPDVVEMARDAGLDDYVPVFVEAGPFENPGGFPIGGVTNIDIPNNHLSYALTWFGLAIVLLAVFLLYARQRLKE